MMWEIFIWMQKEGVGWYRNKIY